jgi:hypothetical protein
MNGGPVRAINFAGREFSVAQDSEVSVDFGGYRNESVSMNGDGSSRSVGMYTPGKITGGAFDIDIDAGDIDFILEKIAEGFLQDTSITLATGKVINAQMQIIGEPAFNTKQGTMEIELNGNQIKP